MTPTCTTALALAAVLGAVSVCRAAEPTIVGPARSSDGLITYTVTSEYLAKPNAVEVLLPDKVDPAKRYPVLYVLPVNAAGQDKWGNGMAEARRQDVHNQYGLICVAPGFDSLPWYADHPTDTAIRQEAYLLKVVLPLIESRHPALAEPRGRLLVGFSKSGWGAFSLLLRHPDVFGRAAAWDAPLMMTTPTKFGTPDIFATQETFDAYRIDRLLERRAEALKAGPPRLILMGYGNFPADTVKTHEKMIALGIPHVYDNATKRTHDWHSGWFAEAVRRLVNAGNAPLRTSP